MNNKTTLRHASVYGLSFLALALALHATAQTVLPVNTWSFSDSSAASNSSGTLTWTANSIASANFQAVTLGVGESLTLTGGFHLVSASNNGSQYAIRFGLFSSENTPSLLDDKGYFTTLATEQGGGSLAFASQNVGSNLTTSSGQLDPAIPSANMSSGGGFLQASPMGNDLNTFTFKITLIDENTLQLSLIITGDKGDPAAAKDERIYTIASNDPSFTKTFDEVGLTLWDNARGSFENISVTYSGDLQPIPEPAIAALVFSSIGIAVALFLRRRMR